MNHPNVVTVHDILTDDEGPYLVLEYIDGESLAQRLQRGAIPWREAIDLLLPICDAVTAAHAQGIIHRDIKPANILLPKKGPPKLARDPLGTYTTCTVDIADCSLEMCDNCYSLEMGDNCNRSM